MLGAGQRAAGKVPGRLGTWLKNRFATARRSTIVFFPQGRNRGGRFGAAPVWDAAIHNCVGIGEVLRERGHRVVFIVEESSAGTLERRGFEERLMRLAPSPEIAEEPSRFWKDFTRDTAPLFRKSTFEQLEQFIAPTWQSLLDGARYVDPRLTEIFEELRPDVIVEDNVCAFPPVLASGCPWVRIVSCNPLELKDPQLPPPYSGLAARDRHDWESFRAEYRRVTDLIQREFSAFCVERGVPPLPDGEFIHSSTWLNLFVYPRDLDYSRSRPLPPTWHNIESSVRTSDEPWSPPAQIADGEGSLIYLSMGSLGSGDVPLMKRLVEALAGTPHRYVVSTGPQHAAYELANNMVGAEFLPQASVLPQADLVITHAGNGTTTEAIHFGKPLIALPLVWDQHDNAQRLHESGLGIRLGTYDFNDQEMSAAISRLLRDKELRRRLDTISARLQRSPGNVRAADWIERVAKTHEPLIA
jgi:MGT family glycosyltransferase